MAIILESVGVKRERKVKHRSNRTLPAAAIATVAAPRSCAYSAVQFHLRLPICPFGDPVQNKDNEGIPKAVTDAVLYV